MNRIIVSAFTLLSAASLQAGEATVDFSSGELPKGWNAVKGEFVVVEGALSGKEMASDKHAAVLAVSDPHKDSTISFRFQMAGAKGFHVSYNHPKGHLFRVRIMGGSASLILDKDKKDPASKPITMATAKFKAEAGKWYDLKCTVKGNAVEASIGEISLMGSHDNLTKEKTGYRFIVAGESVLIDDVSYSSGE